MKKLILLLTIFSISILSAQDYKKCNTTYIMNKELAESTEYQIARKNVIIENKEKALHRLTKIGVIDS